MTAEHLAIENYACPHCRAVFRTAFQRCPLDGNPLEPLVGDPLAGSSFADRYVIEECVGEGGMGRVYRARHQRMSRLFAIKVLFGDHAADKKMQARLAREAEAASRLSHPNVISVLDFGDTDEGLLYLVMDYVAGPTLAQLIEQQAPLEHNRVIKLTRGMARGLAHAHKRNLIHRDFKADNVIISSDGAEETAKIVDFGIAVLNEPTKSRKLTTEGMVLGTPAVMAPEQAVGEAVDHRTDLFSLGVVLYEMLCGRLPFDGSPLEIARQNLANAPPRIAQRVPGLHVDPELEALSLALMGKRPEDRPSSAKEVLLTLARIEGESSREFRRNEGAFLESAGLDPMTPIPGPTAFSEPSGAMHLPEPSSPGFVPEPSRPGFARPPAAGLTEMVASQTRRNKRAAIIVLAVLGGLAAIAVVALTGESESNTTTELAAAEGGDVPAGEAELNATSPDDRAEEEPGADDGSAEPNAPSGEGEINDDEIVIDEAETPPPKTETAAQKRRRLAREAKRRAAQKEAKAKRAAEKAAAAAAAAAKAEAAKKAAAEEKAAREKAAREKAEADDDLEEKVVAVGTFNARFKKIGATVNRAKKLAPKSELAKEAGRLYSRAASLFSRAQGDKGVRKTANRFLSSARSRARSAIRAVRKKDKQEQSED